MSNLAPFKYPFNLIEDTIYCRGMVLSEYLLHALGRMTQETKARRMNEGVFQLSMCLDFWPTSTDDKRVTANFDLLLMLWAKTADT